MGKALRVTRFEGTVRGSRVRAGGLCRGRARTLRAGCRLGRNRNRLVTPAQTLTVALERRGARGDGAWPGLNVMAQCRIAPTCGGASGDGADGERQRAAVSPRGFS